MNLHPTTTFLVCKRLAYLQLRGLRGCSKHGQKARPSSSQDMVSHHGNRVQASKPSGYRFGLSCNVSIFNLNQYCKLHIEFLHPLHTEYSNVISIVYTLSALYNTHPSGVHHAYAHVPLLHTHVAVADRTLCDLHNLLQWLVPPHQPIHSTHERTTFSRCCCKADSAIVGVI